MRLESSRQAKLTLGGLPLPVTPPDPDPVDHVSLLGLVTQPPGLVGPGRPGSPVDDRELTVLPTTGIIRKWSQPIVPLDGSVRVCRLTGHVARTT